MSVDIFSVNLNLKGIDFGSLVRNWNSLIKDDDTMVAIHNALARYCDPYVPMKEGVLAQTTEITAKSVKYTQPYAHYMYVGDVYGPNIPIKDKDGNIVGWFSPPGQTKHPTGAQLKYNKKFHPKASKEWDKAMMAERGQEFTEEIKNILIWRAKKLYG